MESRSAILISKLVKMAGKVEDSSPRPGLRADDIFLNIYIDSLTVKIYIKNHRGRITGPRRPLGVENGKQNLQIG